MSGRTPHEAVRQFLQPLQLALSCVTRSALTVSGGYYPRLEPHGLSLAEGSSVLLRGSTPLEFSFLVQYRIVESSDPGGPWMVSTVAYYYALAEKEGAELLAYHWHPTGRSPITVPHLHLGPAAQIGHKRLAAAHLPTNRVMVEDVLRLAIDELGVQPLREDWSQILSRAQTS